MVYIPFKNTILSSLLKNRYIKIENFKDRPLEVQNKVFKNLIKMGEYTVFGADHKFSTITDVKKFQELIPIRKYEEFLEYINKARKGHKDILWPGHVKWFAKSSGTTDNKSKYIPITNESLKKCHYKAGKDMLSLYSINFPETNLYNGKGLMLGGSQIQNKNHGYFEGDLSAILISNFPFWVHMHRVPDLQTALMSEWEKKVNIICSQAINENITNITGVPSWTQVVLKKVLEITKSSSLLEVWPNLELYMHGGVHFSPYVEQFYKMIPSNDMNYVEGYNASEGFFGIQDTKYSKDLLLMLDYGIFYEFILLKDYKDGIRETVLLSEVIIGEVYVMIISTNAGLWRYVIGDTIRFTSLNPFRIRVVGRTKNYINAFGEELMVENVERALYLSCQKYHCSVQNFIVAPKFIGEGRGVHQWIVEFQDIPNDLNIFSEYLDQKIRELNSDYDAKRTDNFILDRLQIFPAKKNVFYKWLKINNRLGGQYKVPRLDNDGITFNEIKSLM